MYKYIWPVFLILFLVCPACREPQSPGVTDDASAVTCLNEAGTIKATASIPVDGPHGWNEGPRIVWLIDEGAHVAQGDTLIRCENAQIEDFYKQRLDDLEVTRMSIKSARAQRVASRMRTGNRILQSRLAMEQAELDLNNRQYEASSRLRQAELDLKTAEIQLKQSLSDSLAQATLDSLVIAQAELKEIKLLARLERFRAFVTQLTVTAPGPGMVVYTRRYTEEGIKAYRTGDTVPSSDQVLEITDTSDMKVEFTVHERDRWRLSEGQSVQVVLDAYTDVVFSGKIENVARLSLPAADGSVARRFAATAVIFDRDIRLKPGMSARVIIELKGMS